MSSSARLLLVLIALGAAGWLPARSEWRFDPYEIVIGDGERQTLLTGHLLDGPVADLAVVGIDDDGVRRLHVYAFDGGTWAPLRDATLPPDVLFVDLVNIEGYDRLLTYAPGRLSWFDLGSRTERQIVAVPCSFTPPRTDEIAHVDLTRDLNDDGRDDLVVPDVDGFRVLIQRVDGSFADPVKLGPPTDLRRILGADGYRYDPWSESRVHALDFDHDGKRDLVYWRDGRFRVHYRNDDGLFARKAEAFGTDVEFATDDLSTLAVGEMTGRALHSLADVNGDGVGDLVVLALEGERISHKRSALQVHFGARTPDGTTRFRREIGAAFEASGRIQVDLELYGSGRDVPSVLLVTSIDVDHLESSLWKRLKGFMGDDVGLHLAFYRMDSGLDPDEPSAVHGIALDGVPSHREPGWVPLQVVLDGPTHERRSSRRVWPRAFNRTLLVGDVTGDGRPDLLIEPEFHSLHIYEGVPGRALFAAKPHRIAASLHDAEYSWLVDLDRDGRQDILTHQPFTTRTPHGAPKRPPGSEPHRVLIRMSR